MTRLVEKHPYSAISFVIAILMIAVAFSLTEPQKATSASGTSMNGYLWSDMIGWISVNCATGGPNDTNICGTSNYGLSIDGSGNITGYAWSDNIGWIQFGGLSGFPSGSGTTAQNAQIVSGAMTGWARACGGMDDQALNQTQPNNTCGNGYGSRTDGWDGWISLSGTSPKYGVTESNGTFSGYAWGGGTDIGWIDFEYATTTYNACTARMYCTNAAQQEGTGPTYNILTTESSSCVINYGNACAAPTFCQLNASSCQIPQPLNPSLTVTPLLIAPDNTAQVTWSVQDVESCTVIGTNGDSWSGLSGTQTTSPIENEVTYTLSCLEDDNMTYYIQTASVGIVPKYEER